MSQTGISKVPAHADARSTLYCSFCGKSQEEVRKLIAGPTVFVCDECVYLCLDIIHEDLLQSDLAMRIYPPIWKALAEIEIPSAEEFFDSLDLTSGQSCTGEDLLRAVFRPLRDRLTTKSELVRRNTEIAAIRSEMGSIEAEAARSLSEALEPLRERLRKLTEG